MFEFKFRSKIWDPFNSNLIPMRYSANFKFNFGQSIVTLYRFSKFKKGIMMTTNIPQMKSEVTCNKEKADDWKKNIKKFCQLQNLGRSLSQLCLA